MSLLGVDIGNTGAKATVFGADGKILAAAYREYPHIFENPGWLEIDPNAVWAAVQYSIRTCNASCREDPVTAMAVSAMGDGFTPVDKDGNFLGNTILTADNRAQEESEIISRALGGVTKIKRETGAVCHSKYPASKILWFQRQRPEIYEKVWKYLGWIELVAYKCGLEPTVDDSNAGKSMMYDLRERDWHKEMQKVIHAEDKLPSVKRAGSVIGIIPAKVSDSLGFSKPVTMILGGFDQACVAIGAGAVEPGMASMGLGTVASLTMVFDREGMKQFNESNDIYAIMPHIYPERFVTCATVMTGGQLLKWFRDQFSKWEKEKAAEFGLDPYDVILRDLPEKPTNILILPHFAGSGTPWQDPYSCGSMFGLSVRHTQKDVAKAILESVAYEMRYNLSIVRPLGLQVNAIRVSGGGAHSKVWLQIIADVLGIPVVPVKADQVGCCGAAIVAGVGTGVFASYEEGIERLVKRDEPILPDAGRHEEYEKRFQIYKELYTTTKDISHRLTKLSMEK